MARSLQRRNGWIGQASHRAPNVAADIRMRLHEVRGAEEIAIGLNEARSIVRECANRERLLDHRQIRIPNHPRIDRAAFECSARAGGREEHWFDVRMLESCLLECGHEQVVRAATARERDRVTLQIRYRFERRVGAYDDRFVMRSCGLRCEIDDLAAAGLGEDRRRTGVADIGFLHNLGRLADCVVIG